MSLEKNCHLLDTGTYTFEMHCDDYEDAFTAQKILREYFTDWRFDVRVDDVDTNKPDTTISKIKGRLKFDNPLDDELADLTTSSDIRDMLFNYYGIAFKKEEKQTYVTLCNGDVQVDDNEEKHEMIGKAVGSQVPMGKTVYKKSRKFAKKHPKLGMFTLAGVVDRVG